MGIPPAVIVPSLSYTLLQVVSSSLFSFSVNFFKGLSGLSVLTFSFSLLKPLQRGFHPNLPPKQWPDPCTSIDSCPLDDLNQFNSCKYQLYAIIPKRVSSPDSLPNPGLTHLTAFSTLHWLDTQSQHVQDKSLEAHSFPLPQPASPISGKARPKVQASNLEFILEKWPPHPNSTPP